MSQNKKNAKKATAVSDDDDRKKGLRQSTIAKSKNNDVLSLVFSAVPDLPGVTGGKKAASAPIPISTEAASMNPTLTSVARQHTPQDRTLPPTALTPKGLSLQDDSIDVANSPSQQKEHLLLQFQIIAHQGEGVSDTDLEATFNDPVHFTIVPSTYVYEELERLDNERYQKQIAASTGSTSGNENVSTPKRKSNKKHRRQTKDGNLSRSSSLSSVEKMKPINREEETTQTVTNAIRLKPLNIKSTAAKNTLQTYGHN